MCVNITKLSFNILLVIPLYILALIGLKTYLWLYSNYEYAQQFLEPDLKEVSYDFVIVGCGTAGSLIAHLLSNQKDVNFVVLEAGGHGGPLLNPPALGPLLHNTVHDWQYETVPQQSACLGMKGNVCKLASGKIVGGSSKLNNMIHLRGYVDEMVSWFNGKYSYNYLYDMMANLEESDLSVQRLRFKTDLSAGILDAASEMGFHVHNLNNMSKTGFMESYVNQKDGARWTTSHLFLSHSPNNGKLITHATVSKIVIDETKTARGVIYRRYGEELKIVARKGVILTAGAIATPQLLMLSGIGPENHLRTLDIPVVQSLPVGQNLIDHVTTGLDLILLNRSSLGIRNFMNPVNAARYFLSGKGPWTTPGCEVVGIVNTCGLNLKTPYRNKNCNLPDLELMVMPLGITMDHGINLHQSLKLKMDVWKNYFKKIISEHSVSILPIVLHPKSVGTVKLRSTNPEDRPLIDPKYLSTDDDAYLLVAGIELIKQLINTKPMKRLGARLNPNVFPNCHHLPFDSTEYWLCYVKHLTATTYHPAGTCKMGERTNETSVVDHNFKIIGVDNLFVADASIFPSMPSGNINSAVALVANVFANQILKT